MDIRKHIISSIKYKQESLEEGEAISDDEQFINPNSISDNNKFPLFIEVTINKLKAQDIS